MKTFFGVCSAEIGQKKEEVQLFPAGTFAATDGRPGPGKSWRISEASARQVIAAASRRKNPFVIDYEHQTLNAERNGRPAPAAGWISKLEWREGRGLYAVDVEWTDAARKMIDANEYRYISPVFSYSADGTVLRLHHAGLTNDPAIDGMDQLAAAKFFNAREGEEEQPMKELLKLLGLAADATEEAAVAALKAIVAKMNAAETAAASAKTELAALKSQTPDPAQYVPFATFSSVRDELAALKSQVNEKEVNDLVADALGAGKLLPAMESWARDLGKSNVAALKSYIDSAQPIAALKGTQTGGNPPGGSEAGTVDDTALAVCKQMGVSPDDYKKTLGARNA